MSSLVGVVMSPLALSISPCFSLSLLLPLSLFLFLTARVPSCSLSLYVCVSLSLFLSFSLSSLPTRFCCKFDINFTGCSTFWLGQTFMSRITSRVLKGASNKSSWSEGHFPQSDRTHFWYFRLESGHCLQSVDGSRFFGWKLCTDVAIVCW